MDSQGQFKSQVVNAQMPMMLHLHKLLAGLYRIYGFVTHRRPNTQTFPLRATLPLIHLSTWYRLIFLGIWMVLIPFQVAGQDKKSYKCFEEAKILYRDGETNKALKELQEAVERSPEFTEAWVLMADIRLAEKQTEEAIAAYRSALGQGQRADYVYFRLGIALHQTSRFKEAIAAFEAYIQSPQARDAYMREASSRMASCAFAIESMANPADYNPENMGPEVNSTDWEYFPALTANGNRLVFTRRSSEGRKRDEDFWFSTRAGEGWTKAEPLRGALNSEGNEGALTLSADGRMLIFAACQRPDGYGSCDLFVSFNRGNNTWTAPRNLGPAINTGIWESQPTLSPDGKTLVFVRGPDQTAENLDIYYSTLSEDGRWSRAAPLPGEVNTRFQEDSPFLHFDGNSLYFSSNGHLGIGQKDFFVSKKQENGEWGKPKNLGWPINTPGDEFSLIVGPDGKTGFFASDQFEGNLGHLDLYSFQLPPEVQAEEVAYLEGMVTDAGSGSPLPATLYVVDLATGSTVLETRTDRNGYYFAVLSGNKDYALNIEEPGYLFFSENFALTDETAEKAYQLNAALQPLEVGRTLALQNIFFDYDSDRLKPTSFAELNRVVDLLRSNPRLKVEIGGHTDARGDDAYNLKLSERRAKSVRNYLIEQGIAPERLASKGYGESQPVADNDTEEGMRRNRRTELRIDDV